MRMGKICNEEILSFAKDFAEQLYEIGVFWLEEETIRTSHITIYLDYLVRLEEARREGWEEEYKKHFSNPDGWYKSENKLEDMIPRVVEDKTIESVMFCEGELWETLYYYEAYGRNDKMEKVLYEAFVKAVTNHGLWYEWGEGIIFLYGA